MWVGGQNASWGDLLFIRPVWEVDNSNELVLFKPSFGSSRLVRASAERNNLSVIQ